MFPTNKNYTLARGELYFGRFAPGTTTVEGGLRYLGNSPEFSFSMESESLDHYDADGPVRVLDDSALIELTRNGSIVLDHISPENIALVLGGSASVVTQAAIVAGTYEIVGARKNARYQIGKTPSLPNGVRGLSSLTAEDDAGTPVALVAGVDYTVDLVGGGIIFLPGSTLVEDDGTTTISIEYAAPERKFHRVTSAGNGEVEGELYYRARNAKGAKFDYLFPKVTIRPDGDFAVKSVEDWQTISLGVSIGKLNDTTEAIYTNGEPGVYVD